MQRQEVGRTLGAAERRGEADPPTGKAGPPTASDGKSDASSLTGPSSESELSADESERSYEGAHPTANPDMVCSGKYFSGQFANGLLGSGTERSSESDDSSDDDDDFENDQVAVPVPDRVNSQHSVPPAMIFSKETVEKAKQQFLTQYDEERMQITPQERTWALEIKEAIEATPDLDNLSDMMICQLAIVGKGNVEWAINRTYLMQTFKRDHGILDTMEDCIRHIPDLVKDRFLLSVDFDLQNGGYICSMDGPKFDLSIFTTEQRFRAAMQRTFYFPLLMCPDLAAVRAGMTTLYECDGYEAMLQNFCIRAIRRALTGGYGVVPARHAHIKFFNTPQFVELLLLVIKPVLSEEVRSNFQVGCKFPGGRLDRVFNVPSVDVAVGRLCAKLEDLIRRRYQNERHFSLAELPGDVVAS